MRALRSLCLMLLTTLIAQVSLDAAEIGWYASGKKGAVAAGGKGAVVAGISILKAMGLRKSGAEVISCPTCGRTEIDIISLAVEVEKRAESIKSPIVIAVMGCVVNGPGEAREADYGIAGGKGQGLLFKNGKVVSKVPEDKLIDGLFDLIQAEEHIT